MFEADGELDLKDYLAVLRRRWRWLAGSVFIVVGLVAVFSLTSDEVYGSRSEVQILTEGNQAVFNVRDEQLFRSATAELQATTGGGFAAAVDDRAGFEVDFTSSIVLVDSEEKAAEAGVLRFVVEAPTAEMARTGADAAAEVYLERRVEQFTASFNARREEDIVDRDALRAQREEHLVAIAVADRAIAAAVTDEQRAEAQAARDFLAAELGLQIDNLTTGIGQLSATIDRADQSLATLAEPDSTALVLNQARTPDAPISPDVPFNLMIGLVVGIVLGLILALMRDLLDPRARDGAELARLVHTPVLATIDEIRGERSAPGRVRRFCDLSPQEAAGYHTLLNSLWLSNVTHPLQTIVFTSDRPQVGKTQTVINLAQAEAARGTRVLVIDTDFVNPSVVSRLELDGNGYGLADLVSGRTSIEMVAIPTKIPSLHVVDVQKDASGGDFLRSDRLGRLLAELGESYDLILIDAMPTLSASDSRLVALQSDGVVVVYDPADSRRDELEHTIELLRTSGANLVGLVANRARAAHPVYMAGREGRM